MSLMSFGPFIALISGVFLMVFVSLVNKKEESRCTFAWIFVLSVLASLIAFVYNVQAHVNVPWMRFDVLRFYIIALIFVLSSLSAVFVSNSVAMALTIPSGFFALLLLSVLGAFTMVVSDHLLLTFVGLELLSVPLYVMTGFGINKKRSIEASFKYLVMGAMAGAMFIYGVACVWGGTHTMLISQLPCKVNHLLGSVWLTKLGFMLIVSSLLFKLGAFPFYFWVLDVYAQAPASLVALMSGLVKLSVAHVLFRLIQSTYILMPSIEHVVLAVALLSQFLGVYGALRQNEVRRMLAYSTIFHVGLFLMVMLVGFDGAWLVGLKTMIFYIFAYALASVLVFCLIEIYERRHSKSMLVDDLDGLFKVDPAYAMMFAMALFSMAGLPPLIGFFGKLGVFYHLAAHNHFVLVFITLFFTLISLGYYLRLIVHLVLKESLNTTLDLNVSRAERVVLVLLTTTLLVSGLMYEPIKIYIRDLLF